MSISGDLVGPMINIRITIFDAAALFSVFAGYTWQNETRWLPSYSLRLNYLYGLSSDATSNVEQFSLPQFENYQAQYEVQSQMLLGVFKLDLYRYKRLSPFISAGLGVAWNRFSDYDEQAFAGITPRVNPNFEDKTHANLAYTLGAGFDFLLTDKFSLSLEYDYGYLGHVKSGESAISPGDNLDSKLSTNMVLLNIVYLLGEDS
jgi:opacity protein-like surface antigen